MFYHKVLSKSFRVETRAAYAKEKKNQTSIRTKKNFYVLLLLKYRVKTWTFIYIYISIFHLNIRPFQTMLIRKTEKFVKWMFNLRLPVVRFVCWTLSFHFYFYFYYYTDLLSTKCTMFKYNKIFQEDTFWVRYIKYFPPLRTDTAAMLGILFDIKH